MKVAGLENSQTHPLDFQNDSVLPRDRIGEIIRRILREEFWCRLEGGQGFIHFAWDYYMYIGVRVDLRAISLRLIGRGVNGPTWPLCGALLPQNTC
jgi:hypothetical protein